MDAIHPDALQEMRDRTRPGDRWAVYENHDLGHPEAGHLQFLVIGPERTFTAPPPRYPDTRFGLGWRYVHVGWVDLAQGTVALLVEAVERAQNKREATAPPHEHRWEPERQWADAEGVHTQFICECGEIETHTSTAMNL